VLVPATQQAIDARNQRLRGTVGSL
jgi:hypothetical protein